VLFFALQIYKMPLIAKTDIDVAMKKPAASSFLAQLFYMLHYPYMDVAYNAFCPYIIVPNRENIQPVPAIANKRSCAVTVVL